jgi:Cu(I)/Ag(I) efflux system membrane protein CusA/SilA
MQDLFQVETVNMSVAVWVGVIALVGIATDNGVVLTTYLKQRFEEEPPEHRAAARERAFEAGMRRLRPCLMTTATTVLALLPVIASQGKGSDVMVRMALPSVGGMAGALWTLLVVPVLYAATVERGLGPETGGGDEGSGGSSPKNEGASDAAPGASDASDAARDASDAKREASPDDASEEEREEER